MKRRDFLTSGLASLVLRSDLLQAREDHLPFVIDGHVHLFNPSRPGGIPWPLPTDTVLYKPALPDRLRELSAPFNVVGAIAIEASPLPGDNDWLLSVVEADPFIVGMIGNLNPGGRGFASDLYKFQRHEVFRGIRYGNLWDRDLASAANSADFLSDLRHLATTSLLFETANPDQRLLGALISIGNKVPSLRIMVDHLPHMAVASDSRSQNEFVTSLRTLSQNPRVYAKFSELVLPEGASSAGQQQMHDRLELLWSLFGEDRLVFGSDWPNGDHTAPYRSTIAAARNFIRSKGPAAERKVFESNSRRIYGWNARTPSQENTEALS